MKQLREQMKQINKNLFVNNKSLVKQQQAFFTPPNISLDMVKFSGINTTKNNIVFMEPSAGGGSIIFEALDSNKKVYCDAVEPIPEFRNILKTFPRTELLSKKNFFDVSIKNNKYRVILMNPPFSLKKGFGLSRATHDVDFVIKAYEHLETEGILVCLISTKYTFRKTF